MGLRRYFAFILVMPCAVLSAQTPSSEAELARLKESLAKATAQRAEADLAIARLEVTVAQAELAAKQKRLAEMEGARPPARAKTLQVAALAEESPPPGVTGTSETRAEAPAAAGADDDKPETPDVATGSGDKKKSNTLTSTDLSKDVSANLSGGIAVFLLNKPQIDTAIIEGGVVTVTKKRSQKVAPWLQANFIFDGWPREIMGWSNVAPGLFIGTGGGPNGDFLDTFGFGGMLAMKRTSWEGDDRNDKRSLNIGVGYYLSTAKRLANGIHEGQPLPTGFESIQYKERSINGWMLNVSFGI